jgi:hypothetical protein
MPAWRQFKRRDFIRKLRALGFAGPYSSARHQFMILGEYRQTIPSNPEFSIPQLRMLVRQVETILGRNLDLKEWESL